MSQILKVTAGTFENEVLKSDKPVLVDFYAIWCGYCVALAPVLEQLASDRPDIKVCKVDTDQQPELAQQYKIQFLPTVCVFKNGEMTQKEVAPQSMDELLSLLN